MGRKTSNPNQLRRTRRRSGSAARSHQHRPKAGPARRIVKKAKPAKAEAKPRPDRVTHIFTVPSWTGQAGGAGGGESAAP